MAVGVEDTDIAGAATGSMESSRPWFLSPILF